MVENDDQARLLDNEEGPDTDSSFPEGDVPPPDVDAQAPDGLSSLQLSSLYNHPYSSSLLRSARRSSRGGRRRSRSRRRRRHHRSHYKRHERNIPAAVFSTLVIVTTATALAEPDWFYVSGSNCRLFQTSHSLGVNSLFFDGGKLDHIKEERLRGINADYLIDCVTPKVINTLKAIIALCFIAIAFSVVAFLMDLIGPKQRHLKILRRHGVWNVASLALQILICGLCYLVSVDLMDVSGSSTSENQSKLIVRFSVSFYLIVGSACANILAAANNLLWRWPVLEEEPARPFVITDIDNLPEISPIRLTHPPPYVR